MDSDALMGILFLTMHFCCYGAAVAMLYLTSCVHMWQFLQGDVMAGAGSWDTFVEINRHS